MNLDELAKQYGGTAVTARPDDLDALAKSFGGNLVKQPVVQEESGFFRQAADVPVGVAKGAVQGVRMIADAFGAGSSTSNTIKNVEDYLGGLLSAQARNDQQEIARIMKDAEDKGATEQVKAALQAFSKAPIDLVSQGLGTAAPAIVGVLGAKILGAGALASTGIGLLTGAGMGAGTVKGTIYEETKKVLTDSGVPEDQAEARAQMAQSYGGKNLDMILAGTALGGLAATTGVEKALIGPLTRRILSQAATKEATETVAKEAAKSLPRRALTAGAAEAAPEFAQASQEKLAENIALQREGFDVPTMRGVVGSGTLEALAGAGLGAGVEVAAPRIAGVSQEEEKAQELAAEKDKRLAELMADTEQPAEPVTEAPAPVAQETFESPLEEEEAADPVQALREDLKRTELKLEGLQAKGVRGTQVNNAKAKIKRLTQEIADAEAAAKTPTGTTGAPSVDQPIQGTGGAGVPVPVGPDTGVPAPGVGGTQPSGVVPAGPTAATTVAGEAAQPSAVTKPKLTEMTGEQIEDQFRKEASGTETPQTVEAKEEGPQEPTPEQRAEALKTALAGLPRPEAPGAGKRLAKLKRDQIGRSYDENRELVDPEGTRLGVLPRWEDLRGDAQDVYLDRIVRNTPEEQRVAKSILSRYLNELAKLQGVSAKKDIKTAPEAAAYELNRTQYEKSLGVRFPTWDNLSNDQRDLFGSVLTDNSTEAQDAAFQILGGDLQQQEQARAAQKAQEPPAGFSSYEAAQQRIAQEQQDKLDEQARKEKEREEMLQRDPWKTDFTPSERTPSVEQIEKEQRGKFDKIRELVKKGNINGVLTYVGSTTTLPIYKTIASRLIKLSLNTKTQFVESLPNDQLAIYDPKTDTIQITERGLRNVTLLHEAVHAATVKVINKYLTGKTTDLTPDQLQAVMQLEAIRKLAERRLGRKLDLYEFVSEALTDRVFQRDLSRLPATGLETVYMPETKSMWTEFTLAMARGLGMLKDLFKPGKKGELKSENVLMEVFGAFEDILAVPDKPIEMAPLPAKRKAQPTVKQAPPVPTPRSEEQIVDDAREQVREKIKEGGARPFLRSLFTKRGYEWTVTKFQNSRRALKTATDRAEAFGILKRVGEDLNDVYGQITRSTGIAVNTFNYKIKYPAQNLHAAIEDYARAAGTTVRDALADLHLILEAKHEPERRRVKYLKTVPLDSDKTFSLKGHTGLGKKSAAGWRQFFEEELTKDKPAIAPAEMRKLLDGIVLSRKHFDGAAEPVLFDESNPQYNVIAGRTPEEIKVINKLAEKHPEQLKKVEKALEVLQEQTKDLNKEANYWSQPVQNIVDFYGYKHYVPFKGRQGQFKADEELDLNSRRLAGEFQDYQNAFEGRKSESENPLLQTLAEGAEAALRVGRKDVTLAIKNAVKDGIIQGRMAKGSPIPFSDRYLDKKTKADLGGPNKIFHYNKDGTIDVIEIGNKAQLESIRRTFQESKPVIDLFNKGTSVIGQMHTRYNPNFAPMDLVRNSLTNVGVVGAELGPRKAGQLLSVISADVAKGGMKYAGQFSLLYSRGEFDRLEKLAGSGKAYEDLNNKERYFRDILDYVQSGGRVSYLQGVAAKGALDELLKDIDRSQILKRKDQVDTFFDIYNDVFELSNRVSTYRAMKDIFRQKGESSEEAAAHAVEYTKNLANFEQVGEWGKTAGAFFMFFRPAATGAVRAIDALAPAFGFNEKKFRAEAEQEGRTPEQIKKAVEKNREKQKNARVMAGSLLGVGAAVYMMALMLAGDDEEGRNLVATDDMARWTRYARFFIPGIEKPIQIPWGFGLGAFASAGAQIASLFTGRTSIKDVASNIFTVGMDSFLPLPVSRISPIDNFPAWAIDSLTPSMGRPFVEYVMNIDGLGREIYNNRQTRYGDAYTGGDNIPEIYKSAARGLFEATTGGIDISPNTMYFFVNNYIDAIGKLAATSYNLGLTLAGQKEFDPKNDLLLVSSYIGTKSNVDAREFSKAEDYVKGIEKRLNSLKDKPDLLDKYLDQNPDHPALVDLYNRRINGTLRKLRAEANKVRTDRDLTPGERAEEVKLIVEHQNEVKRQILEEIKDVSGFKP